MCLIIDACILDWLEEVIENILNIVGVVYKFFIDNKKGRIDNVKILNF